MLRSRRCPSCPPTTDRAQLARLPDVATELEAIESLSREIQDLTWMLRGTLSPEVFKLVWSLRDAVETLGLCEAELRERRLLANLAMHLPEQRDAIRALRRHILADDVPIDGAV